MLGSTHHSRGKSSYKLKYEFTGMCFWTGFWCLCFKLWAVFWKLHWFCCSPWSYVWFTVAYYPKTAIKLTIKPFQDIFRFLHHLETLEKPLIYLMFSGGNLTKASHLFDVFRAHFQKCFLVRIFLEWERTITSLKVGNYLNINSLSI